MKIYIVRAGTRDFGYYSTQEAAEARCQKLAADPNFYLAEEVAVVERRLDADINYVWMTDNV